MTPFRLAFLNLSRKRVPTAIAIFSIALAVACAGVLLKLFFLSQSRFQTLADEGQVLVGAKSGGIEMLLGALNLEGDFPDFVPYRLYESLSQRQAVKFEDGEASDPSSLRAVIPFLYFADVEGARVIATTQTFIERPEAKDALVFSSGGWVRDGVPEVVVGAEVAKRLRADVGTSLLARAAGVPEGGAVPEFSLTVTGILKPTGSAWDHALFSSVAAGQRIVASSALSKKTIWGADVLHHYLIYMDPQGFPALKSLVNERTVAQAILIADEIKKLERLTGTGQSFGLLLMALILFLGGASVATLMVTRFEAMSVQIAVLRAIGYRRAEISAWLLWEGALLGGAACLLGGLCELLVFPFVREAAGLGGTMVQGNFLFQTLLVWLAALCATMLAISVPVLRLLKQNIHASLKG
jgi:putative ABC transport system permease protein